MAKSVPVLVQPSQPTPYEVIPLTKGSVMAGLNTLVSNHLLVFRPSLQESTGQIGGRPADVIRSGLSQVLVPYYPLAGRIVENETGWEVQCNGRGAVFIVTSSPLHEETAILHHTSPMISTEPVPTETILLPPPKGVAPDAPVLTIQVTELSGGGFVLSIKIYKGLCDTAGLIHFLCGWAEMCRGKQHVSVLPLWKEEQMHTISMPTTPVTSESGTSNYHIVHLPSLEMAPSPEYHAYGLDQDSRVAGNQQSSLAYNPPPSSELFKLDVPLEMLKALVDWLHVEESCPCSAPQALAAHVWRERTRALQISDTVEARLFFISRAQESRTHPVAYYGSFAFNCQAKATVSELLGAPLSAVVRRIQAAEATLVEDFTACTTDFKRVHGAGGHVPPHEVLLFTNLPSTSSKLDFGMVAKPVPPSDTVRFPPQINIAAVAPPSTSDTIFLTILMNNVPAPVVAQDLRSLICNLPLYIPQDSRM